MGKKKHAHKKNADVGLAVEQFWELDKEFYNTYPRDFFLNRLEDILVRIAQPEKVSAALNGTEIKIGKLSTIYHRDNDQQAEHYAKIELFETYIHCMESFFRLFLARASLGGCDWLSMVKLSISDYRSALSKIGGGDFEWLNSSLSGDSTITYAFAGVPENGNGITPEILQNWKSWILHCAYELSEVKAYNSYKHGLTVYATVGGFSMQPEDEDIELGRHGDTIRYLTVSEKDDRFVWVKKTEFIDLDTIAYKIFVYGQLISSMIHTGRHQHGFTEETERWYPGKELTPNLAQKEVGTDLESLFQAINSFTFELLYYSDSDHSVRKADTDTFTSPSSSDSI